MSESVVSSQDGKNSSFRIETETIFPIPENIRRGNAWSLATVWLGANQTILTFMTGMIYTQLCNLSVGWAILAIMLGNVVGGIFMALHAAQGPHLGIPQMQQTRGQFGVYGSLLVILIVIFMYIGFASTLFAISRDQSTTFFGPLSGSPAIYASAFMVWVLCTVGHALLERFIVAFSYIAGIVFVLIGAIYVMSPFGVLKVPFFVTPSAHDFLMAISVGVLWQVAYAPYVSDYSRYLPVRTGEKEAFYGCLSGSTIGAALPMIVGAYVAGTLSGENYYESLKHVSSILPAVIYIVFFASTIVSAAMQIYCATLSSLTLLHTFAPAWKPSKKARTVVAALLVSVSALLTMSLSGDALNNVSNFLLLLLAVLSPWTAINLVDYYLIRHGHYDIPSLYRNDGGIYGFVNGSAVSCYVLGIVVQVPFVSNSLYTGVIANQLGGIDISWILGIVVPGVLYWILARRKKQWELQAATSRV
ncbi:purine-cytosine permease family protein [Acetobacter conturbans]|uniref:Thiamine permease n=1 Tax=Acetobacter conturbans TaxID=1737472 RepID=A0ABX0K4M6_9PROT|nr:cytosine permease [Acetobacter conturbans]NHN89608.1 thiamine permease [Acetobacter conturbans]